MYLVENFFLQDGLLKIFGKNRCFAKRSNVFSKTENILGPSGGKFFRNVRGCNDIARLPSRGGADLQLIRLFPNSENSPLSDPGKKLCKNLHMNPKLGKAKICEFRGHQERPKFD
jgi:hypothetical protein